ncbi:MAG: nucleotide exchange factor GrpE [Candidatus Dojkabacteria bacterium]
MKGNNKEDKKTKNFELQIQELANTIDALEDEKLEISNQLKRALADYQNLEKNTEKFLRLRFLQVKKNLVEDILPITDSLTIAIESKKALELDEKTSAWVDGVSASIENLEKVLADMGLTKFIPKKGDKFDPEVHEAITVVDKGKKDHIFDTIQPGYKLDDILIRPARVAVSK